MPKFFLCIFGRRRFKPSIKEKESTTTKLAICSSWHLSPKLHLCWLRWNFLGLFFHRYSLLRSEILPSATLPYSLVYTPLALCIIFLERNFFYFLLFIPGVGSCFCFVFERLTLSIEIVVFDCEAVKTKESTHLEWM